MPTAPTVINLFETNLQLAWLEWAPNSTDIFFTGLYKYEPGEANDIYLYTESSSSITQITSGATIGNFDVAPGGGFLVAPSNSIQNPIGTQLQRIDLKSQTPIDIRSFEAFTDSAFGYVTSVTVAPDESFAIFSAFDRVSMTFQPYVVDLSTRKVSPLLIENEISFDSLDLDITGKALVIGATFADLHAPGQIWLLKLDENSLIQLTDADYFNGEPSWSPDGEWIAFESWRNNYVDIYIIRKDGTEETRLTSNPANDERPVWSPDGKKIVFISDRSGRDGIYLIDVSSLGISVSP
jgi:WD40 repeat protein